MPSLGSAGPRTVGCGRLEALRRRGTQPVNGPLERPGAPASVEGPAHPHDDDEGGTEDPPGVVGGVVAQRRQQALPGPGLSEFPTATGQGQLALAIEVLEPVDVKPSKAPREHPHRQEEVGPAGHPTRAIWGQAAGGEDTVQVRVGLKLPAPGVQYRQSPKFGSEMLGIASDVQESLRGRFKTLIVSTNQA